MWASQSLAVHRVRRPRTSHGTGASLSKDGPSLEIAQLHAFVQQVETQKRYVLIVPRLQELVLRLEMAWIKHLAAAESPENIAAAEQARTSREEQCSLMVELQRRCRTLQTALQIHTAEEARAADKVMIRLRVGWQRRTLRVAFCTWDTGGQQQRQHHARVVTALWRLWQCLAVHALFTWHHYSKKRRMFKARTRRAIQRLLRRTLVLSLERWRQRAAHARQHHARVVTALWRLWQRLAVHVLFTWLHYSKKRRMFKARTRRAIQRLLRRTLVLSLERWRQRAAHAISLQSTASQILPHLVTALHAWRRQTLVNRLGKRTMRKMLSRLVRGRLMLCWAHWQGASAQARHEEARARGVIVRLWQRALASCFEAWLEFLALVCLLLAVCVCVCVCVCTYIYMYMYIDTFAYLQRRAQMQRERERSIRMYVYIYIHICMYIYIYMYTYIHIYIYKHTHTYIHTYVCVCKCVYIYI